MNEHGGWNVSPAYDLNFSDGPGGEHWMLVGEGVSPPRTHLEALAKASDVKGAHDIVDEVRAAVDRFSAFADEAGVRAKTRGQVAKALGVLVRTAQSKRT